MLCTLLIPLKGFGRCLKSVFIYFPLGVIKGWMLRVYLGYQIQGVVGAIKSLLSILSWCSAWRKL